MGAAWTGAAAERNVETSAETLEYQLKAGFLINFAKFVQWPTNSLTTNEFRIGVLDDGTVFPVLDAALVGKQVEKRLVKVIRVTGPNEAASCQMLFVSRSTPDKSRHIYRNLAASPVLTVGEETGFAAQGGCINLVPQQQHLRFEINLQAAEQAGLQISAKLASLAKLVETEAGR